jgi:hypothetical protein
MRLMPLRADGEAPGGRNGSFDWKLFEFGTQPRRATARSGGGPTTRYPAVTFSPHPCSPVYAEYPECSGSFQLRLRVGRIRIQLQDNPRSKYSVHSTTIRDMRYASGWNFWLHIEKDNSTFHVTEASASSNALASTTKRPF